MGWPKVFNQVRGYVEELLLTQDGVDILRRLAQSRELEEDSSGLCVADKSGREKEDIGKALAQIDLRLVEIYRSVFDTSPLEIKYLARARQRMVQYLDWRNSTFSWLRSTVASCAGRNVGRRSRCSTGVRVGHAH